ncbi:MAG: hypothetical protein AB7O96_02390 [Pseudobdellovibrionaceae bacterium]
MKYLNQVLILAISAMILMVAFQNCGLKTISDGTNYETPALHHVETTEMTSAYDLSDVKSVQILRATNSLSKTIKGDFFYEQNILQRSAQIEVASGTWENKCPNDPANASSWEASLANILDSFQENKLISSLTYDSKIYKEAGDLFSGLMITINLKNDKTLIYNFSHVNDKAIYPNSNLPKEDADLILNILECAH